MCSNLNKGQKNYKQIDKSNKFAWKEPNRMDPFVKELQGQVDPEDYFKIFFHTICFQRLSREQTWQQIKEKLLLRTIDRLKDWI